MKSMLLIPLTVSLVIQQQLLPIEAKSIRCEVLDHIIKTSSEQFSIDTLMLFREKGCNQIVNLVYKHGIGKVRKFLTSVFHMKQLLDAYKSCKQHWLFIAYCRRMILESPNGKQTIENFVLYGKLH